MVSISGVTSSPAPLCFGVSQGSVLGPTLFVLYNSSLHSIIRQHRQSAHYFPDDTQIYTKFQRRERTRSRLIVVLNAAQKAQKHRFLLVKKVCRSANYQLHRISRVRKCFAVQFGFLRCVSLSGLWQLPILWSP